jgi:hypothetical protein
LGRRGGASRRSGGHRIVIAEIGDFLQRLPFVSPYLDHQGLLGDDPFFERVHELVERHHADVVRTHIHVPAIFGFTHSGRLRLLGLPTRWVQQHMSIA